MSRLKKEIKSLSRQDNEIDPDLHDDLELLNEENKID